MQFFENIRLAFVSIMANKMRSLLTMLGIIIGISAVITITTIGSSIQKTLTNTFNSMGNMNYFEIYAQINYSGDYDELPTYNNEDTISRSMLNELTETYPDYFTINISDGYGASIVRNYKNQDMKISINGILDFSTIGEMKIIQGRKINYSDNINMKHTINVSDLFASLYFENGVNPIGQTITIEIPETGQTEEFVIVGVYELPEYFSTMVYEPGQRDIDKITPVYVPIDTMAHLLHRDEQYYFWVDIFYNINYDIDMQEQIIREFFNEKFQEAEKSFMTVEVMNMQKELKKINTVVNVVTVAISVIAAISLIVGGVGVMNIMLVSITERTKEIGIRKALGAQNSSIRMQFVTEAILMCIIGGVIGIIIGIVNGMIISYVAETLITQFYPEEAALFSVIVQPSVPAIIISVLFSAITGVFFGYYPANKAAKMNPIDALRYD